MNLSSNSLKGFTLVEVLVSLILTSLAFTIFLQALNTGKSVRQKSELRTKQSVILNSLENQIRARRFDENLNEQNSDLDELEQKIVKILDQKIRPAVARDGGDIKFKEFKDGVVKVQLQGSCSGCPSSTMTLKQGVQNLLCHYLPEVKEVVAI